MKSCNHRPTTVLPFLRLQSVGIFFDSFAVSFYSHYHFGTIHGFIKKINAMFGHNCFKARKFLSPFNTRLLFVHLLSFFNYWLLEFLYRNNLCLCLCIWWIIIGFSQVALLADIFDRLSLNLLHFWSKQQHFVKQNWAEGR